MNIVLLGHYDFASNLALSELVQGLAGHQLTIFLSGPVTSDAKLAEELLDLGNYDRSLCDRLNSLPASTGPAGRRLLGFKELEEHTGSVIEDLARPNSAEGIARLALLEPDLVVSVRYRRILKEQVLRLPRLGVINLHSGLLPQYKGVMATFWAMLEASSTIGSTLHFIDDGSIDTGRIIGRQSREALAGASYLAHVLSLYPAGCGAVIRAVQSLHNGELIPAETQEPGGRYYSFPDAKSIEEFHTMGHRFYDGSEFEFALNCHPR